MTTRFRFGSLVLALTSIFIFATAYAADVSNLVAPIYTGAVPAVLANDVKVDPFYIGTFGNVKALDCGARMKSRDIAGKEITAKAAELAGESAGPWCFLTRDPIDKVKAFYDKAVGPMRAIQGEHGEHGFIVFAERAWYPGGGEDEAPGLRYSDVSVHALAPPRVLGNAKSPDLPADGFEGQEAYKFYAQSHHFGMFIDGVDWFGDPSKRKQAELDALYKQYGHLEAALFQRKGPTLATADALLAEHYGQLREQRQKAATMAPIAGLQQARTNAASSDAGPTAAEDAQFNSVMQKNPQLAQRYMALTQQAMQLAAQGKDDEADAIFDQIDELEQSNPELAALNAAQEERSTQIGARQQAQEDSIVASGNKQMDEAIWGTALEYLKAVDNEDYYTLIVIDNKLKGYEKDYSKDRATIDAETAGWVEQAPLSAWNISYRQPEGAASAPAASAPAPADEQSESQDESPKEKVKKGLRGLLKGLP
jgi:hypothetical protein